MERVNTWMLQMYVEIASALTSDEGQTFAEYALIFVLVVLVAVTAFTPLGTGIQAKVQEVANYFQ